MVDAPKLHPVRRCWFCGEELGRISDANYDRRDTCSAPECNREARHAYEEEREEAHRAVDRDFDGGW